MRLVYRILLLALICGLGLFGLFKAWQPLTELITNSNLPLVAKNHELTTTFAVIGDNEGDNSTYENLISQIAKDKDIQFLIHVGDATTSGTTQEFSDLKRLHARLGLTIPVYFVPGNHDLAEDLSGKLWEQNLGPLWQAVDINNIHLVLLDNANRKIGFTNDELAWLEKDLANLLTRQLANQITIIAYHRPFNYPLASILGDDETKTSSASNLQFLKILNQYPPTQIFTGHIHSYLDYNMSLSKDSQGKILKSVPVTISGGGGQPAQNALGGLLKTKYHALKIKVINKTLNSELILPNN